MVDSKENIVTFKSYHENFVPECRGVKNNTVRVVDPYDARFNELRKFNKFAGSTKFIKIINTDTSAYFTRRIKHICFWKDPNLDKEIVIITWFLEV